MNAASWLLGPVAPGEVITILGSGLGPDRLTPLNSGAAGLLENTLAETRVLFDGDPAPLIYVQARQLSAVVPYSVAGKDKTQLQVERGTRSAVVAIPAGAAAPGIFTADSSGKGQGAILNPDGSINSATNPAARDLVVVLYATGEAQTDPPAVDGERATDLLARPRLPLLVWIGGLPADVLYAGAAPGLPGVLQVNVRIPAEVPSGTAILVLLTAGSAPSQPGVTLAVQ